MFIAYHHRGLYYKYYIINKYKFLNIQLLEIIYEKGGSFRQCSILCTQKTKVKQNIEETELLNVYVSFSTDIQG